jgi:hypothetical protein
MKAGNVRCAAAASPLARRRAREARIAAHEPQEDAVGAQPPKHALPSVEPILDGGGGRAPAAICRQVCARAIEIVAGWHHDHRDAAVEGLEGHRKLLLADIARANPAHVRKTEHITQELFDECDRGSMRGRFARREVCK